MSGAIMQQVSDPYAEAILSLGISRNCLGRFAEDVRFLLSVLERTPQLKQFLANPIFKPEAKKLLLDQNLANQVDPTLMSLLKLLVDRRRAIFLESVCRRFLELQRKFEKTVLVEVVSVTELTEAQNRAIREKVMQLQAVNGVELQSRLDPNLIGGIIIKTGSQVIDLSLRGQLRRMALQLT
jgi:F-type H+-transporting ATPase subunit delta